MSIPVSETNNGFNTISTTSYPLLLFWTVAINIDLSANARESKRTKVTLRYKPKDRLDGTIYNGGVLMDMEMTSPSFEMKVAKFAPLASSESGYWALLLEQKDEVAERRGVVRLDKGVLKICQEPGPRWEAITLG